MTYTHTILVPKKLVFKPEYYKCPHCGEKIQKHIICEGALWHIHSYHGYGIKGIRCSEPDCEDNHGLGKCKEEQHGL